MKINFIDNLTFDIYIKNEIIGAIDLTNKNELEKYFKKLFRNLNNNYNIKIEGFYDISVYIDKYYGIILHLEKDNIDYYEYFKNQVDMRISTINTEFLYLVEDIPISILNKIKVNTNEGKIYIKLIKDLTPVEMMDLTEFSNIIYNK